MFKVEAIRKDFPILSRKVNGHPLVYFDNAATSQTPQPVIDTILDYYTKYNSNIHRGVHALSQEATDKFEKARQKIQRHFNAEYSHEIILTAGVTAGINLVANGFGSILNQGDEIIVSALEHHSNIVPWQMLCEKTGAILKVIPMNLEGELVMDVFESLLSLKTKLVFVNHISNALGTINPIELIIKKSHQIGAAVLIDGAQACPHIKVDVKQLDADFYLASPHKMCGPTGIGVLYGKRDLLNAMPPIEFGGDMNDNVEKFDASWKDAPYKFETGTPPIAEAIGLGAAIDYLENIGLENIAKHEKELKHAKRIHV